MQVGVHFTWSLNAAFVYLIRRNPEQGSLLGYITLWGGTFAHRPSECVHVRATARLLTIPALMSQWWSPSTQQSPPVGNGLVKSDSHSCAYSLPPAQPPLQPSWGCRNPPPSISHLSLFFAPSHLLFRSTIPTALYSLTCHSYCCSLFVSACLGSSLYDACRHITYFPAARCWMVGCRPEGTGCSGDMLYGEGCESRCRWCVWPPVSQLKCGPLMRGRWWLAEPLWSCWFPCQ